MRSIKRLALLFLILICGNAQAQRTIQWYRLTADTSTLNYNPFLTGNTIKMSYYNINPNTGEQYRYAGSSGWVKDSIFRLPLTVETGQAGADWTPEQFGAINANQTFSQRGISQAAIDALYPGIGATVSDNIDWAAWQMAVYKATSLGGGVKARGGTYYLGPKPITVEKYAKSFQLDGNYSTLISTGTNVIITRPSPTSNSDANVMVELKCTIRNLFLQGTSTQIGIDLGPSYGAVYQNINCKSLGENIHLRFALRTTVENCFSTNCNKGWIADIGNWSGASNSNSQSNHTTFRSCRWFGSGDLAFLIFSCSGCVVEDCIVEGQSVRVGIEWDGNGSTVVKDGTVRNCHFECTGGATEAFIKVRLYGGEFTLDKSYGQYATILLDAGATVGYLNVVMSNVPYWVKKSGKLFNNAGNVSWVFLWNDCMQTASPGTDVPSYFNGTVPSLCSGAGCGSNRFFYTPVPR